MYDLTGRRPVPYPAAERLPKYVQRELDLE